MAEPYTSANGWVNTLINKAIEKLQFNKTIAGTIIDDSGSKQGRYQISTGDIEFQAYTDNSSYKKDETVYILIPNGDFSEQKIILCKKYI